jgi:phosphohistidine swiveling domain-containing protein
MIKTANEAVYFRSYRTELWYSSARYFTTLFKEIAKQLKLADYKDVLWLYWDESVDLLNKGKAADTALIAERKKNYVYFCDQDGKYKIWQGKEAQEIFEAFQKAQSTDSTDMKEVRGSGAYPGKVKGKAVVVANLDELDNVREADILVVHATNVNFVPALKKVSAIVTEEGGILSHAAIISRELRIPAVIGTKTATKVFKDGDFIEVDAEKGIVRRVE